MADNPLNLLGSVGKRRSSNPLERSSRRRLELDAETLEADASVEIEKKELELEIRRRPRDLEHQQQEMEQEIESQKEAMELVALKRRKSLSLKMKKLEIIDLISARGSITNAGRSFCCQKVRTSSWANSKRNKLGPH